MAVINFKINNKDLSIDINPLKRLLDVLRYDLKLTAPKEGCGEGECGACSVIINGKLVNSCLVPIGDVEGKSVLTLEGLKDTEEYEVLGKSFEDAGAVQCGFCIPGMITASFVLLKGNSKPNEEEIRQGLSGNLCRCTGYEKIIKAVIMASERGEALWKRTDH